MPLMAPVALVAPAPVPSPRALDGQWVSACVPIGQNGRHGYITHIAIRGHHIRATAQLYATSRCDTPTLRADYAGDLRARRAQGDHIVFEHIVRSVTITPQDQSVVDQYNKRSDGPHGCGLPGWQKNVAMPVAGQSCPPFRFAAVGTRLYDAAWLEAGTLRFGAFPLDWRNDATAKRPNAPASAPFRRVSQ